MGNEWKTVKTIFITTFYLHEQKRIKDSTKIRKINEEIKGTNYTRNFDTRENNERVTKYNPFLYK